MRSYAFAVIAAVAAAAADEKSENKYYHDTGAHYYGSDVTPYEYSHGLLQGHESHYPEHVHAAIRAADESAHHVLEHRYDDAHDVEMVPFKERAVLKAVDRPESHSYGHTDDIEPHVRPTFSSVGLEDRYEKGHAWIAGHDVQVGPEHADRYDSGRKFKAAEDHHVIQ